MGGGPWVKGIRVCSGGREKEGGSILGFPLKLLWGEMSCWDGISSKRSKSWDHLMHAIEVGEGEA